VQKFKKARVRNPGFIEDEVGKSEIDWRFFTSFSTFQRKVYTNFTVVVSMD